MTRASVAAAVLCLTVAAGSPPLRAQRYYQTKVEGIEMKIEDGQLVDVQLHRLPRRDAA